MQSSKPLVSIIIPCFNDSEYIEKAVSSALNQKHVSKEIIIVDDGSDKKTRDLIKSLESKVDKVIFQENKGVSVARNNGIKMSLGEYILVLDSDDYFEGDFCRKALDVFKSDNNICLVTCYARWFNKDGTFQIHKPTGGDLNNFLYRNCALSNSMFTRKSWENVGGYDESMINGWEDWEFFIRLHKKGGTTYVIPKVLFHYRKQEVSKTSHANEKKYDLLKYIFTKHSDLYIERYPETLSYLINSLKSEQNEKIKFLKKIDFKIGKNILYPLRFIRGIFNKIGV